MSECKKHKTWLVNKYHYQLGNFELHVERHGIDASANEWGWDIWRSQPFDQILNFSEVEPELPTYMTLNNAKETGLLHLKRAVASEMVECECCEGRGKILKSKPSKQVKERPND